MANPDKVVIGTPVCNRKGQAIMVMNRELNNENKDVVVVAVRSSVVDLNLAESMPDKYTLVERKSKQWKYYTTSFKGELVDAVAQSYTKIVNGIELPENAQYDHPFGMKTMVNGQLTALVSYRFGITEIDIEVHVNLKAIERSSFTKKLMVAGYKSHGAESGWQKFVETIEIAQTKGYDSITDYVYNEVHMPLANSYKKVAKN